MLIRPTLRLHPRSLIGLLYTARAASDQPRTHRSDERSEVRVAGDPSSAPEVQAHSIPRKPESCPNKRPDNPTTHNEIMH